MCSNSIWSEQPAICAFVAYLHALMDLQFFLKFCQLLDKVALFQVIFCKINMKLCIGFAEAGLLGVFGWILVDFM